MFFKESKKEETVKNTVDYSKKYMIMFRFNGSIIPSPYLNKGENDCNMKEAKKNITSALVNDEVFIVYGENGDVLIVPPNVLKNSIIKIESMIYEPDF